MRRACPGRAPAACRSACCRHRRRVRGADRVRDSGRSRDPGFVRRLLLPSPSTPPPGVAAPGGSVPASLQAPGSAGGPPRQLFVPDLIAATPSGITPAQLARISKLTGVRAVLPVDGGKVTVNGQSADVLGVSPQAFRSWTPPETATANSVWADLNRGRLTAPTPRPASCTCRPETPIRSPGRSRHGCHSGPRRRSAFPARTRSWTRPGRPSWGWRRTSPS